MNSASKEPVKKHILLLDDDLEQLATVDAIMKNEGYETTRVQTLLEAKESLENRIPDCAVLDLNLGPNETGVDFIKDLRAKDPNLPILFVTGNPKSELFRENVLAGTIYSVMEKPVTREHLTTKVEWALEKRRMADADEKRKNFVVKEEDEFFKLWRRSSWKSIMAYFAFIGLLILIMLGILRGIVAWEYQTPDPFGVYGFMDRVEGYLQRSEQREMELRAKEKMKDRK